MNECENLQQQLDEYLSDRISDFARRRIDSHLRDCPTCAEDVRDFREAIDELRSVTRDTAIEPTLSLQYSVERLASARAQHVITSRSHYFSLILFGILMLLFAILCGGLQHYGTARVSIFISAITALVGMAALSRGLFQYMRTQKK